MGRPVRSEIATADREMGRFIRSQYSELRKLGFPRMATFARDIARGDIGMPPPTQVDPLLDCIGAFFFKELRPIERRMLTDKYLVTGTQSQRATWVGLSIRRVNQKIESVLYRLSSWLSGHGY